MNRKPNRLKLLRKRAGLTQEKVAAELEVSVPQISRWEGGINSIPSGKLGRVAEAYRAEIAEIFGTGEVAIVGSVGSGGAVTWELNAGSGPLEYVERPPETEGELQALRVVGDSQLPKYDPGDILFIRKGAEGVPDTLLGAWCVCRLLTGETYVRRLARGSRPGVYTLRSLNAADIEDVPLDWATPIRFIRPADADR